MSNKKKDEVKIDNSISETKNPNNIKVYKDPLFNIGDIVRSGLVRSYLIAKTKKGMNT